LADDGGLEVAPLLVSVAQSLGEDMLIDSSQMTSSFLASSCVEVDVLMAIYTIDHFPNQLTFRTENIRIHKLSFLFAAHPGHSRPKYYLFTAVLFRVSSTMKTILPIHGYCIIYIS
jgi:uncharacterized membrane protein YesL